MGSVPESLHELHDSRSFDLLEYIQEDDLPEQRATRSLPYFAKGPNSFTMDTDHKIRRVKQDWLKSVS